MMLVICWGPVIDVITDHKYGAVNNEVIFLLALVMPILYINNYLWTINFAEGKLKMIFLVMAVSFAINIAGCLIMIPLYKNEGAALANLITLLVQLMLYLFKTSSFRPGNRIYYLLLWPAAALVGGFFAAKIFSDTLIAATVAALLFLLLIFASRRIRRSQWTAFLAFYQL